MEIEIKETISFALSTTAADISSREFKLIVVKSPEEVTLKHKNKHNLWAYIWAGMFPLAELLFNLGPTHLRNKNIIELGAGGGLSCIVAAGSGANVLVTDFHPYALDLCRLNVELNYLNNLKTRYELLNWHNQIEMSCENYRKYDILTGSDVLYMGNAVSSILSRIDDLITKDGISIIVDPGRNNYEEFYSRANSSGMFECELFEIRDYCTPVCKLRSCVFLLCKRSNANNDDLWTAVKYQITELSKFKQENQNVEQHFGFSKSK